MVELLERGDVFFLYRPRVERERVKGIADVQRLDIVLHARGEGRFRRLFVAEKSLPNPQARRQGWARVEDVRRDPGPLEDFFDRAAYRTKTRGWREQAEARPAGEGVYALARHGDHVHLAYALELPQEPGDVQRALGIAREGSYIVSVRNPANPAPQGTGLHGARTADFPPALQARFRGRRFAPAEPALLDTEDAELLLVGAGGGAEALEHGLDPLRDEDEDAEHAEMYRVLRLERDDHPAEPLLQGVWR